MWTSVAPLPSFVHLFFHLLSTSYAKYWHDNPAKTEPSQAWVSPSSKGEGVHQLNARRAGSRVWCYSESTKCRKSLHSLDLGAREDSPGKSSREGRSQPSGQGLQYDWASRHEAQICLKIGNRDLPGSPVVRTLCFLCRGVSSIPGEGTKIPEAAQYGQKKKNKDEKESRYG